MTNPTPPTIGTRIRDNEPHIGETITSQIEIRAMRTAQIILAAKDWADAREALLADMDSDAALSRAADSAAALFKAVRA